MSDIDILARTIYGEARGEGRKGMEAVAFVVINRFRARKWFTGYAWENGIQKPSVAKTCLKRFQFSCWNKNDPNFWKIRLVTTEDNVFCECLKIAEQAIAGELKDFTGGAVFYHAKSIKPKWAENKKPCIKIGNHLFYREE
ncbi:MAG: cell wall hydrolase [Alphaproteobacteria bacterium]|nr:cell wall hydrolase [Alphaproteobacteria bacterium]